MATIQIEKALSAGGGRYVGRIDGVEGEAEIRFAEAGAGAIRAEHTHAPDSMRGTGAALALVERMVADARTAGFRIAAVCPYIRAQLKRHPEWGDVMDAAASPEKGYYT